MPFWITPKLDFLDIVTRPSFRIPLVRLAAANRLHITCQKPFAPTLKAAQEMIEICEQAEVVLNIHENWRWRSWYREIKSYLDNGEIGSPHYAQFNVHGDYWLKANPIAKPYKEHGTLMEWGIHHLDVRRYLFGKVETVYGNLQNPLPEFSSFDKKASLMLNFESGLIANLYVSSASFAPYGFRDRTGVLVEDVRIEGDQGTLLLRPDPEQGDRFRCVTKSKEINQPAFTAPPEVAYQASYTAAHQHFIDCLASGEIPETNAGDNLETLAVTLAAYHSAGINQVVTIEDFVKTEE